MYSFFPCLQGSTGHGLASELEPDSRFGPALPSTSWVTSLLSACFPISLYSTTGQDGIIGTYKSLVQFSGFRNAHKSASQLRLLAVLNGPLRRQPVTSPQYDQIQDGSLRTCSTNKRRMNNYLPSNPETHKEKAEPLSLPAW